MVGFRFRINDLPEEADEPRILITRLFLPFALLFLAFGGWAGWKYFQMHAPPDHTLREVRLANVTKVTGGHDPTRAIQTIHLLSRQGSIDYSSGWPRFEQVRSLDPNLSLLADSTNLVWALKSADGTISERDFFLSLNLEAKSWSGVGALFFVPSGLFLMLCFWLAEREMRKGTFSSELMILLPARKIVLLTALFGYLFFYGLVLAPLLGKSLPSWALALIWVLTCGLLGNLLVRFLGKWRTGPSPLGSRLLTRI